MKKVGLIMACCSNYGALLQSFATQQIVKRFNVDTEIILYQPDKINWHIKLDRGLIPFIIDSWWHNQKNKKIVDVDDEIHRTNKKERQLVLNNFCNNYLENRRMYYGYKDLCKAGGTFDAVIIGSDQMWHPGFSFGNHISLRFVPRNVRTISYATSLGVSKYPRYCWHSAKNVWKRLNYLSVREEQGKEIINKICPNIPVKVLVDPTYLLTKEEWLELMPFKQIEKERYVLCYFLGNDEKSYMCAQRFARRYNLKLLSILSDESSSLSDTSFADRVIVGADVVDFINLIRGADYVFTDSFHGTAFSVINEKQFFVIYRKRNREKLSRNSRIDNILSMWKLQDRLIVDKDLDWNKNGFRPIDYKALSSLVNEKREEGLLFLSMALNFSPNDNK